MPNRMVIENPTQGSPIGMAGNGAPKNIKKRLAQLFIDQFAIDFQSPNPATELIGIEGIGLRQATKAILLWKSQRVQTQSYGLNPGRQPDFFCLDHVLEVKYQRFGTCIDDIQIITLDLLERQ